MTPDNCMSGGSRKTESGKSQRKDSLAPTAALNLDQATLGKLENREYLFSGDSRIPLQEIIDRRADLEIFEEQGGRYMSAFEPPHTPGLAGSALHHRAFAPVKHSRHDKPGEEDYKGGVKRVAGARTRESARAGMEGSQTSPRRQNSGRLCRAGGFDACRKTELRFALVALNEGEYVSAMRAASELAVVGGSIYDFLLLAAARTIDPKNIYAWNVKHFHDLAPDWEKRVRTPKQV